MVDPTEQLEDAEGSQAPLERALRAVATAEASRDWEAKKAAVAKLGAVLGRITARADLAGRRQVMRMADRLRIQHGEPARFAAGVPSFEELATQMYLGFHGPKLALEIDRTLTGRVTQAFQAGQDTAVAVMRDIADWTRAYAQTVYRTNFNSAFAAGRFMAVRDPAVREVVPAFEFHAAGDGDTRPNHLAADGLIASVDDAIWNQFSPPLGYNCRCALRHVDRWELEDLGLLREDGSVTRKTPARFASAGPDDGFQKLGRPDRRIYPIA